MLFQIALHLLPELLVVGPGGVEPDYRRGVAQPGPVDRQLDPAAHGLVPGLAHAPDVAGAHAVLHQCGAISGHDPNRAVDGNLEGLVVAAILLSLLGDKADVGHAAPGRGVEGAVLLAVFDDGLIDASVAAVGDDGLGILQLALGIPHAPRISDHGDRK